MSEEIGLPCSACGEIVNPDDAFVVDVDHLNGASETIVFHKDPWKACPQIWSLRKLEEVKTSLQRSLVLLKGVKNDDILPRLHHGEEEIPQG